MKIIITAKDTDNIIGVKEAIAMRLEDMVDIVRIDVGDDGNESQGNLISFHIDQIAKEMKEGVGE